MGGTVPWQALQFHRKVEQALHLLVAAIFLAQFRYACQRPFQIPRIGRVVRHQLSQTVDLAVAHLQHAPRVAQHCARF